MHAFIISQTFIKLYLQSSMLAIDDSTLNKNPLSVLKELKIQYEKTYTWTKYSKILVMISTVKEVGLKYDCSTKKSVIKSYQGDLWGFEDEETFMWAFRKNFNRQGGRRKEFWLR